MRRNEAMQHLRERLGVDDAVVVGIGRTSPDWKATGPHDRSFYIYSSMSSAGPFGLGLALAQPQRRVWVLEGDGGVLMALGALATAAEQRPLNLRHLVFADYRYGATGNQPLPNAQHLDLAGAAAALGARARRVASLEALSEALDGMVEEECYSLMVVDVEPAVAGVGSPRSSYEMPLRQRARFLRAMGVEA